MSKTNQVQLIGNIGQAPKLIETGELTSIATFSMATNDTFKDQDGNKQKRTDWHNIVCFSKLANLVSEYTKAGSKILVNGKIQTRQYTNKEGINKYITEIIATDVMFLDSFVKQPIEEEQFNE